VTESVIDENGLLARCERCGFVPKHMCQLGVIHLYSGAVWMLASDCWTGVNYLLLDLGYGGRRGIYMAGAQTLTASTLGNFDSFVWRYGA